MLIYGAEAWTLSAALAAFERKVLRMIFGPVRVGDDYFIRTKRELYELFNDMDFAKRINILRFRWLGPIIRMDENECLMKRTVVIDGRVDRVRVGKTRLKSP